MFLFPLHASLLTCILPVLSLVITVPTQPHPRVNTNSSILLTWEEDDPSYFSIAVHRNLSSPGPNVTSIIQDVENFTATRNMSLVFPLAGSNFLEARKPSPTQANVNDTFAQSAPFQVDEDPTGDVSTSSARDADYTTPTSSATVSSTINSSTTASTSATSAPSSNPAHKGAIIAGVVCGAFLFASITTVLLIWRYRKRRNKAPSRAFLNDLDDKRQPRTSRNDRPPHDPPPPYSPRISRVASKLFRWARGDDNSAPSKTP